MTTRWLAGSHGCWAVNRAVVVWACAGGGGFAHAGYTTLIDNGPSANRVDMVFVGDGYTASQQNTALVQHVDAYLDHMFEGSLDGYFFGRYRALFNVHLVESISPQAGADIPAQNIYVNTLLDASYESTGFDDRLLVISTSKANALAATALSGSGITADMKLATVNSTKYGGSGGPWAVWAGGNTFADEVALHELGHSFAGLADEYGGIAGPYAGGEPFESNATADPALGKWDRWLGYDDPDTAVGSVGYYEGGRYYDEGIWRPTATSKMRALEASFDAVSREGFLERIFELVDPLDDWRASDATVTEAAGGLWVQSADADVFAVDWYVDGVLVVDDAGEWFDVSGLGEGEFEVSARAYDRALDFAYTGQSLDWWRLADVAPLEQWVTWQVSLGEVGVLLGDYNGSGVVEQGDLDLVLNHWGQGVGGLPLTWLNQLPTEGLVDQAELDAVLNHWGESSPPDFRGVVVPEPWLSACVGVPLLLVRRGRRVR